MQAPQTVHLQRRLAEVFCAFGPAYKRWLQSRLGTSAGYSHVRALDILQAHGPRKISSLGDELGVTPRYMTELVDTLETEGLVRRGPFPGDRRATLVALTKKGAKACSSYGSVCAEVNSELLSALSSDQQRELLRCLEVLLEELQHRGFANEHLVPVGSARA